MLFVLNFDIKDPERADLFTHQLDTIGESFLFLPKCIFLETKDNINGTAIYNRLKPVLKDEDLFFITSTSLEQMNGWLSNSAVDWLKTHK